MVLEFKEEKQTFTKVERGNVDFFLPISPSTSTVTHSRLLSCDSRPPNPTQADGGDFYVRLLDVVTGRRGGDVIPAVVGERGAALRRPTGRPHVARRAQRRSPQRRNARDGHEQAAPQRGSRHLGEQ